jgi:hypothetical protein
MTPFARERRRGIRPWRLGARTRKIFLVAHIASAGAWIGIDVVMGVLVFTALFRRPGDEGAVLPGAGAVRRLAAHRHRAW